MVNCDHPRSHVALLLTVALGLVACGDELGNISRPSSPIEVELVDLVDGPLNRANALNVVAGRGFSAPRVARVDDTDQWDITFAVVDGEPKWLPRGFFDGIELSAGIRVMQADFEDVELLPRDEESYELEQPLPATVGTTYGIRSRTDPTLSLPCHVFAKMVVDSIAGDPQRVWFRVLWNPNCDDANVTPGVTN
ncbi:MAG: hypothetical protein JSW46_15705 [Gemmatimonadota bacterium]|nr:MAG: hypothetical protein JSW46_15705 [Gemmatimonadota bacterium]